MSELSLIVNGRRYQGWKAVRVTRSIETLAGSFELDVSDRWGREKPWPIVEEDACRVAIDDNVVIDGFVDRRRLSGDATTHALAYTGRDRAAALVDCSAVLKTWSFRNVAIVDFAKKLAEPFGISVSVQPGLESKHSGLLTARKKKKQTIIPGDKAWDALHKAAIASGVLVVSDGRGGILITQAGASRATALVQGQNVLRWSVEYDAEERYRRYIVVGQVAATQWHLDDDLDADAGAVEASTKVRAEALDSGVRRADRVLVILPAEGITTDRARQRADWEARVRAAKAETVHVTVLGWRQPSGPLWPINAIANVTLPAAGVDGDMLISEAEYAAGPEGEITQLKLVRPDAFTPEPTEDTPTVGSALWKDIAKGVKP